MPRFAVAQMNTQDDIAQNLRDVEALMQQCQTAQVDLLVLPENFACFAPGQQQQTAQRYNELVERLLELCQRYKLWLIAGTLPCSQDAYGQTLHDGRVCTVSLCLSPQGVVARYDKIHLFDAQVNDAIGQYQESKYYQAGDRVVVAPTPFGQIGMMVCYDLRFPELALALRTAGADILVAPAAFTYQTGQLHWQLLLRARALDSQCLTLGAAQQGWHGSRQTWGHAAVADCRGQLLAEQQQAGLNLLIVDFDQTDQELFRSQMPFMAHRRLIEF